MKTECHPKVRAVFEALRRARARPITTEPLAIKTKCPKVRAAVEALQHEPDLDVLLRMDPESLAWFLLDFCKDDPLLLGKLVRRARNGDSLFRKLVEEYLSAQVEAHGITKLQEPLESYAADKLMHNIPHLKPGKSKYEKMFKDNMISYAVYVCLKVGLKRTRTRANYGSDKMSACAVVKAYLARRGIHLSEERIERITDSMRNTIEYKPHRYVLRRRTPFARR